ncbi:MAG TPA: GIY-YIG nuclease family protein [Candidatus Acidoferrum sp.]|nr:GIY-YIG nuclease family protein [Candidatus Acidoferrum sp.]
MHGGYVYILSSKSGVLYIGVTSRLDSRFLQHKLKLIRGFSTRYHTDRLIYFERFEDIRAAIAREKQLKGWIRAKKVSLIESLNPAWRDLSENMFP